MDGRAKIRNIDPTAMAAIPARSPARADIFAAARSSCAGISALLVASQEDKIVGADEVWIFSKGGVPGNNDFLGEGLGYGFSYSQETDPFEVACL